MPSRLAAKHPPTPDRERSTGSWGGPTRSLALALVALLAIYAAALFVLRPTSSGQRLPLDVVIRAANDHRLQTARFLDQDSRITGLWVAVPGQAPHQFVASYPSSDAATNDLLKTFYTGGARITVDSQSTKRLIRFVAQFLLPLLILADLFALLFSMTRTADGAGAFSLFARIGDKRLRDPDPLRFSDVAASEEALTELAEIRDFLADRSAFDRMGARPPKGVLLVGPPGCGKTLLARAVAGEAEASFFNVSGSEFVESLVGIGAGRVRDLFRQARASAPSIVFIDELDAVGRQRGTGLGGGHDEREQTLNELLVQMDGFSPSEGIVVMAATNRPDILDPALLRPGRFDRHITVERPDLSGRLAILRVHARGKRFADAETDLPVIAAATSGFTGADLANVLNEAALLAVRERAVAIDQAHLDEAVERVVGGPRRRVTSYTAEEKRRIAYHEAGHAVVAAAMGKAGSIEKVSIISRGRGVGHLAMLADGTLLPTRADMEDLVAIAMAGIAAEELRFGQHSVGSESDLQRATETARDMAGRFGMSERIGRVRVLSDQREVFLGRDYLLTKEVSQPTLEHLDGEVRQILSEQEERARLVLRRSAEVLEAVAEELAGRETIRGDHLRELLAQVPGVPIATFNGDSAGISPSRGELA
ncbi:MAG: ATP-dependent zinc metalloprotease FtsH [Actinomycetota bacterium]|nr:ATP-dependent zinc metalloprotease FtsH [Actinomycetota bacterium]